jgi:hypothetical protein
MWNRLPSTPESAHIRTTGLRAGIAIRQMLANARVGLTGLVASRRTLGAESASRRVVPARGRSTCVADVAPRSSSRSLAVRGEKQRLADDRIVEPPRRSARSEWRRSSGPAVPPQLALCDETTPRLVSGARDQIAIERVCRDLLLANLRCGQLPRRETCSSVDALLLRSQIGGSQRLRLAFSFWSSEACLAHRCLLRWV